MASAPEWHPDRVANAVDLAFQDFADATVADMMAAAKYCEESISPTIEPHALHTCLQKWITERGLLRRKPLNM
jgi:hypothetical protein